MAVTSQLSQSELLDEFRRAIADCEALYRSCAKACIDSHPELAQPSPAEFFQRMLDLYRGLLAKVFVTLIQADWHCSPAECELADELIARLWGKRLTMSELRPAVVQLVETAEQLSWSVLVGPFERLPPLRVEVGRLEAVVLRFANIVTKVDGTISPEETRQLEGVLEQLHRHLHPIPLAEVSSVSGGATDKAPGAEARRPAASATAAPIVERDPQTRKKLLAEALAELDALVGLEAIKQEVHELNHFLQVQQQRAQHGLPQTRLNLHMVFSGNPGTGKTTVARILGKLLGAMGILSKGQLIETDRSGLVAEYSGQTAPKANKRIDEALDGVLFIDEAYSLAAGNGDDAYGAEAVQTLLKRMEDDRQRLVVIIAGYPAPMQQLLKSNPGLSSRFSRSLVFPDYTAVELGRITEAICQRDHYVLPAETRARLLLGFQWLLANRDEHFGNGRLVRNLFETAIRRMASRIAGVAPLTRELLTRIAPEDIVMDSITPEGWVKLTSPPVKFRIACPKCRRKHLARTEYLGQHTRCKQCGQTFVLDWGDPDFE